MLQQIAQDGVTQLGRVARCADESDAIRFEKADRAESDMACQHLSVKSSELSSFMLVTQARSVPYGVVKDAKAALAKRQAALAQPAINRDAHLDPPPLE
jgi:hypothetical protein